VAIDPKHLPEDPRVLQQMVLDLMVQLDRESAERTKIETLLRELLDSKRSRKSEQLSADQLALFAELLQARQAARRQQHSASESRASRLDRAHRFAPLVDRSERRIEQRGPRQSRAGTENCHLNEGPLLGGGKGTHGAHGASGARGKPAAAARGSDSGRANRARWLRAAGGPIARTACARAAGAFSREAEPRRVRWRGDAKKYPYAKPSPIQLRASCAFDSRRNGRISLFE